MKIIVPLFRFDVNNSTVSETTWTAKEKQSSEY